MVSWTGWDAHEGCDRRPNQPFGLAYEEHHHQWDGSLLNLLWSVLAWQVPKGASIALRSQIC